MQKRLILSVLTSVSFAPALAAQGPNIWLPPRSWKRSNAW